MKVYFIILLNFLFLFCTIETDAKSEQIPAIELWESSIEQKTCAEAYRIFSPNRKFSPSLNLLISYNNSHCHNFNGNPEKAIHLSRDYETVFLSDHRIGGESARAFVFIVSIFRSIEKMPIHEIEKISFSETALQCQFQETINYLTSNKLFSFSPFLKCGDKFLDIEDEELLWGVVKRIRTF